MSRTYIPAETRRLVAERAQRRCEYCLIHEDDTYFGCQIDHIVSEKHGGSSALENLAYACTFCNRNKGSDIGSILTDSKGLVRFFDPRTDRWTDHFAVDGDLITIVALTQIGEVTAHILAFNDIDRLMERDELHRIGRYPPVNVQA